MGWLSREISFLLARLVTNFVAVLAVTQLLENGIVLPERGSDQFWLATFSVAVALAILNTYMRPALELVFKPISCLLKLLTFGLSHFVISALVFWVATMLVDDFTIVDIGTALLGTVIVAAVGVFGSLVFGGRSTDE